MGDKPKDKTEKKEENTEKSFNTIYKYNGANCLSII